MLLLGVISISIVENHINSRHQSVGLQKILSAKLDWDYPGDYFKKAADLNLRYFVANGKKQKTIFIGDSNMEQYAPRIAFLLKNNPNKYNTAVVVGNQLECNLIVELIEHRGVCDSTIAKLNEVVRDDDVTSVVFVANWITYEKYLSVESQFENFVDYIKTISLNDVYIILNMPTGAELDPKNMFYGSRLGELKAKSNKSLVFDMARFNHNLKNVHAELMELALRTNSIIINPLNTFCKKGICPIFDDEGNPLYRDSKHITASYAKQSATFIDSMLQ